MRRTILAVFTMLAVTTLGACATSPVAQSSQFASRGKIPVRSVSLTQVPARSGGSSPEVARFVRAHYRQLQFCHDAALARGVAPTGTATVEVTLAEDGYVLRARVIERAWDGDDAGVEDCMLTTVRRWVFPKSGTMDRYVHTFGVSFGVARPAQTAQRTR
jgi:hypothetical protein